LREVLLDHLPADGAGEVGLARARPASQHQRAALLPLVRPAVGVAATDVQREPLPRPAGAVAVERAIHEPERDAGVRQQVFGARAAILGLLLGLAAHFFGLSFLAALRAGADDRRYAEHGA